MRYGLSLLAKALAELLMRLCIGLVAALSMVACSDPDMAAFKPLGCSYTFLHLFSFDTDQPCPGGGYKPPR